MAMEHGVMLTGLASYSSSPALRLYPIPNNNEKSWR
jgi:hypothetical protein